MKRLFLARVMATTFLWAIHPSGAAETNAGSVPSVLQRGLSAFSVNGARTAIQNWTRGGPLEGSLGEDSEIEAIEKLEKLYGRYQGYSLVDQVRLSRASMLYFLEIQLEDGPVYMKFHVFDGRKGEQVVSLTVEAIPERILPDFIWEKRSNPP